MNILNNLRIQFLKLSNYFRIYLQQINIFYRYYYLLFNAYINYTLISQTELIINCHQNTDQPVE